MKKDLYFISSKAKQSFLLKQQMSFKMSFLTRQRLKKDKYKSF